MATLAALIAVAATGGYAYTVLRMPPRAPRKHKVQHLTSKADDVYPGITHFREAYPANSTVTYSRENRDLFLPHLAAGAKSKIYDNYQ